MEVIQPSPGAQQDYKSRNRVAIFAVLLSVIAIIISLVLYNELKAKLISAETNQIRLADGSTQLGQSLRMLDAQVQSESAKLSTLNETLQNLSQMMGPLEHGLLIQAEYLAQLAQLNLKYQGDVAGALSLLQMADQRLAKISLSPILEVRQVLAKNIAALEAVPAVDLSGVITQLNALSDQVEKLPLVPELPRVQATLKQPKKNTKLDTYLTDWKDALSTSWHALERVVIIRHHGQPMEPLLAPEEYLYLKQNIQLQLQQAQWAALHQQQAIYVSALQRAASWVNHYFTDNGLISRAVQHSLGDLQKVTIQPVVPDITASLNAIQQAEKRIFEMNKTVIAPKAAGAAR